MNQSILHPIGTFHCDQQYPQQAPRQGVLSTGEPGRIILSSGQGFEQALSDLAGFERIWVIYLFDRNSHWKPMVSTPRGGVKRGLFSTRAPYRPNRLGLSCLKLLRVKGLELTVSEYDLLDETPILDIKPYLPYADSFPQAKAGWTDEVALENWQVEFTEEAMLRLGWIRTQAGFDFQALIETQLAQNPADGSRKRVVRNGARGCYRLAGRTWRADFELHEEARQVRVYAITSGYSQLELDDGADPYQDKGFHRMFRNQFGS